MSAPRVAIVYDWVTTPRGGAEKVLVALHQAFPEAELYTSVANLQQAQWARQWQIHTSFLQKIPGFPHHHRWTLPFLPLAFDTLDLNKTNIVISVTSAFAKGVITNPDQLHVSYILTPPRFLYSHRGDYLSTLQQWLLKPLLHYLRWWDQVSAWRPDLVISLSHLVADRFKQTYGRSVDIILPPLLVDDIAAKTPLHPPQPPFFVVVSRLVAYKRIDLVIQACQELQYQLFIIGVGPERANLEHIVHRPDLIHFLGSLDDGQARWYLAHAKALVMPGQEDFGITALEAASMSTPTILQTSSGVAEVLQSDLKMELATLEVAELKTQLQKASSRDHQAKPIPPSASKYATTTFVRELRTAVLDHWSRLQQERTS